MSDVMYTDRAKIDAILAESSRLRYLLTETYAVKPDEITSIRVDGDNVKVDVSVGPRLLRFKAKGTENALVPDPSGAGVKLAFDPAIASVSKLHTPARKRAPTRLCLKTLRVFRQSLAQALYNLVDEFARG